MDYVLPDNLKNDINTVLMRNQDIIDQIEIEVKIRDPRKDNKIKTLEERLIDDNYKLIKTQTIDYYIDKVRVTYKDGKYFNTSKKELIKPRFFKELKFTMVSENNQETQEPLKYDFLRKKKRKSYQKDNFSIDITEILDENKVELEVEVLKAKDFDFAKLNNLLEYIFIILFGDNPDLISDFTIAMGRKENTISKVQDLFSKARDLEYRDLTHNGILQPFTISPKADGKTAFLYFNEKATYLVYVNSEEYFKIAPCNKNLVNSLFVGEIIESNKLKKHIQEEFLFLPYDCLRFKNEDIRYRNYLIRYKNCQNLYNKNIGNLLIEEKKLITYQENTSSFNQAIIDIYKIMPKLDYHTDGIILTPINSPYVTAGQLESVSSRNKINRVLSEYLDVIKYKLPDDLTIDFLVKEDGPHTNKGLFKGSKIFPVKDYSFQIPKEMIGDVVEFKPHQEGDKIIYKFERNRTKDDGKKNPNNFRVADILWRLRHKPIDLSVLEGRDIKLMRRYHNQIKSRIIEKLSGFVVDIGSGNGADMPKYLENKNIKDVLFIEPNPEFLEEFKRRKSQERLYGKEYRIVKGGGEDTALIIQNIKEAILPKIKNKDDNLNINMMISLSFFWKDKEFLKSLANTILSIKNLYYQNDFQGDVYFNFLSIEGKSLKKLFSEKGNQIKLNNIYIRKVSDNEVFINIKESKTVKDQTEYFVYLDQLFDLIDFEEVYQKELKNDDPNDYILSKNEEIYSSLFVYGSRKFVDKSGETFNYQSLEVNETKGKKIDGKLLALGDDEISKLPSEIEERLKLDNLYRVATMKKDSSLKHSFLKLLNPSYRDNDVHTRRKIVNKFPTDNLEDLPVKIIIISKDNIQEFNKDKDKTIYLLKNEDGYYEPIIKKVENIITRVF